MKMEEEVDKGRKDKRTWRQRRKKSRKREFCDKIWE